MRTMYRMNENRIEAIGRVQIHGKWLYVFRYYCGMKSKKSYAEVSSAPCGQGMYPVLFEHIEDTLTDTEFEYYNSL